MAGIGFKLRRYVEEGSYFGVLKGYAYSAVVAAGPWLISALFLGGIAAWGPGDMRLFQGALMYIFPLTLFVTGLPQFVVTRFLADKLYAGDVRAHAPAFVGVLGCVCALQGAVGAALWWTLDAPPGFRVAALGATVAISGVWMVMAFIGVLRAYQWAIGAFIIGGAAGLAMAVLFGYWWGQTGAMAGFAGGQAVILALLSWRVFAEFPWEAAVDFSFASYFARHPWLAAMGPLYYLSSWADKLAFRFGPSAEVVAGPWMLVAADYETAFFIAQLTTVPALAIFFLKVETDFYERYRGFFAAVAQHRPFAAIESARGALEASASQGFGSIVVVQGAVSSVLFLLAPEAFRSLGLDASGVGTLRWMLIGALFQALFQLGVVILLYFERYWESFSVCAAFFAMNAALGWLDSRTMGVPDGAGFAAAAAVAAALVLREARRIFHNLPEAIFMGQVAAGPALRARALRLEDGFGWRHVLAEPEAHAGSAR